MAWHASLALDYSFVDGQTQSRSRHSGPLRVLKSLYPRGPALCHDVVVHPPSGMVSGDAIQIDLNLAASAEALISTPGAARYYRAKGGDAAGSNPDAWASQTLRFALGENAQLEWLPLESIAYPGCRAKTAVTWQLQAGARLMAWDIQALGLDAAGLRFDDCSSPHPGIWQSNWHWPGHWQERMRIQSDDVRLLDSPTGMSGRRCFGTLVLAHHTPLRLAPGTDALNATLAELHALCQAATGRCESAATSPNPHMLVLRCLGQGSEQVSSVLRAAWALLRKSIWQSEMDAPRMWSV